MSEGNIATIEASLAAERQALAATLGQLRDRMAPAALRADGLAVVQAQARPMLGALDRAVRARPLTAAVAGVAVAALALGSRGAGKVADATPALAGTRHEALSRWEDEGGPVLPDVVVADLATAGDDDWLDEAMGVRGRARALLARIDEAARAGLAPLAELAAYRTAALSALARDTAAALGRGIEGLAAPAREAALVRRERAYRERMRLADGARRAVDDHPIATGLALAAAGAAIACLFRQTEAEDRVLGPLRDDLIDAARKALRHEVTEVSELAAALSRAATSDLAKAGAVLFRASGAEGRQVADAPFGAPVRPH